MNKKMLKTSSITATIQRTTEDHIIHRRHLVSRLTSARMKPMQYKHLRPHASLWCYLFLCIIVFVCCIGVRATNAFVVSYDVHRETMYWDHAVDLNEDFRVLWTISDQSITFELQVRALGYVGIGFSADGNQTGADMAIGWVDRGHTFFQDRYVDDYVEGSVFVDPSQDYMLIMGYENATHTVLRFRRKLDTCDALHDVIITNNTMHVMYMYFDEDPPHAGSVHSGALPNVKEAWRTPRSLILTQKLHSEFPSSNEHIRLLELRNTAVDLPYGDDTLLWCQMFKIDNMPRKHHVVRFEPIFDSSWSIHYLQHITLYECQGSSLQLEEMVRQQGRQCAAGALSQPLPCNAIVASWARGSEGFNFPKEAGYPLESNQARFYLLETQFSNLNVATFEQQFEMSKSKDNSGLRLYITERLREHDAGVLSIGIEANWRHIIPPEQKHIVSQGHCIEDCTKQAFPPQGIHLFAALLRSHQIGREITLRQIRKSTELPPIARDNNIDLSYQDFRQLSHTVLPGDRLIADCIYDSSAREAITLGGHTLKEEICNVVTFYYPRQQKLTTCHSLPSLPTMLHSLGIQQLATTANPVVIALPRELAGMTLETRLLTYDWQQHFNDFQLATLSGTFKPMCRNANNEIIPTTENLVEMKMNITKAYTEPRSRCHNKRIFPTEPTTPQLEFPVFHSIETNELVLGGGPSRNSRSSLIETLALSGASNSLLMHTKTISLICLIIVITLS